MKWYWKVRCYTPKGSYYHCIIETDEVLHDIDIIQDFYKSFTGCKMLLEGMSNMSNTTTENSLNLKHLFEGILNEHSNQK